MLYRIGDIVRDDSRINGNLNIGEDAIKKLDEAGIKHEKLKSNPDYIRVSDTCPVYFRIIKISEFEDGSTEYLIEPFSDMAKIIYSARRWAEERDLSYVGDFWQFCQMQVMENIKEVAVACKLTNDRISALERSISQLSKTSKDMHDLINKNHAEITERHEELIKASNLLAETVSLKIVDDVFGNPDPELTLTGDVEPVIEDATPVEETEETSPEIQEPSTDEPEHEEKSPNWTEDEVKYISKDSRRKGDYIVLNWERHYPTVQAYLEECAEYDYVIHIMNLDNKNVREIDSRAFLRNYKIKES